MNQETVIRLHYDTFAEEYDVVDQLVGRLLSRLQIQPDSSILDIGCATGNLTLRLPEVCSPQKVVGIDLSGRALSIARTHAQEAGLSNFEFLCASTCRLPFSEKAFDVVVSNIVFHLIPDQKQALAEVVRVLRPSGAAVLQFLGGGEVAPEMVEIIHYAWNKTLPGAEPPKPFYKLTVEMTERHLTDLGIDNFDITWRRRVMRIGESVIQRYLDFLLLVAYFWRWSLNTETADRIEDLIVKEVMARVSSNGYCVNTANHLLVEFTKP